METITNNPYDIVPYKSQVFRYSHPNYTGAIGTLCGVDAVAPSAASVLEIGCASGGNLIPMALQFSNSKYLGIDYSARQIEDGHKRIAELGLSNIQFKQANILDLTANLGTFDYIIAHGVYSWISAAERESLLSFCGQALSPNGIAYISYNTYPGWHIRHSLREMIFLSLKSVFDPRQRVKLTRKILNFIKKNLIDQESGYSKSMIELIDELSSLDDSHLAHDFLNPHNNPLFFSDFVEHAKANGLLYIAESPLEFISCDEKFNISLRSEINNLCSHNIMKQQYVDFLNGRTLRQSLLVRQNQKLKSANLQTILDDFYISGKFFRKPFGFESANGTKIHDPATSVAIALNHLSGIWPKSCTFKELSDLAAVGESPTVIEIIRMILGKLCLAGALDISLERH